MEYKSVPKPLETKIDLITSIDKPAKSSCRRYGLKICYGILLLVVLIYCMYLHYSYLQVSGKFEELQNSKSKAGKAILKTKSLVSLVFVCFDFFSASQLSYVFCCESQNAYAFIYLMLLFIA